MYLISDASSIFVYSPCKITHNPSAFSTNILFVELSL